jgi:O-antigen ligase
MQFLIQFLLPLNTLFHFWTQFILPLFLGATFAQSVADYPSVFVNIGGHTFMRTIGTFPDPHMLSFYLGMTAPLAIGLALAHSTKRKFFLGSTAIILLADLLTFSRGGYLGLIAGLFFILTLQFIHWSKRTQKIIFILLFTVILIIIASPIGTRLASSFNVGEGSNQGRIAMWKAASALIIEHPLTGVGLGNYSLAILPSAHYRDPIYAHNLFLDIAAETGVLNACIFALIIFLSFFAFLRQSKQNPFYIWPAVSLIIFSTHALVETPLYSIHILPLLILLITISARSK